MINNIFNSNNYFISLKLFKNKDIIYCKKPYQINECKIVKKISRFEYDLSFSYIINF